MSELRGGASVERTREPQALVPRHVMALETALRLAHAALTTLAAAPASEADLRPIADALSRAVVAACGGFDGATDPLGGVRDAVVALDEAKALLTAAAAHDPPLAELVAWLDNARGWLLVAEERQSRVVPTPLPIVPLRASQDEPALHHPARAPLSPHVSVAEPKKPRAADPPREKLPPPSSVEELEARVADIKASSEKERRRKIVAEAVRLKLLEIEAMKRRVDEPPPGFAPPFARAWTAQRFVEARCRECFEEVAMIGMQRAPLLAEPWRAGRFLERRMLASIDAIAALGSVALAAIEPMVLGAPAKDPSRGFAAAMIAGSVAGRDTLAMAERVLRHLGPKDGEVQRAVAGALSLVPHPDLPNLMRAWADDPDPGMRAIAIDVLSYRGLATPDEIARAARDPEPVVVAPALYAAGLARTDELDELVARGIEIEDPAVRAATYWAMVVGGSTHATDRVEKELGGKYEAEALLPFALGASERHVETMVERLGLGLDKARIAAAGWMGSPLAFPALLSGLDHDDPEIALACAFALDRITGANLLERTELPPEKLDVSDDLEDPDIGEPPPPALARQVSDPRDLPSDGSPDVMNLPSTRRVRWEAFLTAEPSRWSPKLRYRRGLPYMARTSLVELDRYPLAAFERRVLVRELVIRTGEHVRVDPHDFVSVQERTIPEWQPHAERASSMPGSWSRPARARR
jgi:HEAT repeat protein